MDHLGFVQPVDRLGQGVVVGVADTAHGGFDPGLGQPFGIADGDVLRSTIGMMDQRSLGRPSFVQGLFQGIEHEIGVGGARDTPADDATRVDVDDKGDVDKALPSRNVRVMAHSQLIRPLGVELPIHPVQRRGNGFIADGCANHASANHALQAQSSHQSLNRATRHAYALTPELVPNLADAVDLEVLGPDALDGLRQDFIRCARVERLSGRCRWLTWR